MVRFKRGLAILLSTCMIGGMMPLPVSAEETVSGNTIQAENIGQDVEKEKKIDTMTVLGFAALDTSVINQTLPVGASEADINFPDTLTVTIQVQNESESADSVTANDADTAESTETSAELSSITWKLDETESDGAAFDSSEVCNGYCYVYTAVLPETDADGNRIQVADCVELPMIYVLIGEQQLKTLDADADHYDDNGFCKGYEIDPDGSGAWVKKTGDDACTDNTCNGYQPMTTVTEDGTTWYEISNAGQLYWFADQVDNGNLLDANVRLTADIVDNEGVTFGWDESNNYAVVATKDGQTVDAKTLRMWNPIGNSSNDFAGCFAGQGYVISGLYYNRGSEYAAGVFCFVKGTSENYAIIERVGLENSYINDMYQSGGIAACAEYAMLKQCYNQAYLVAGSYVGGILSACDNSELRELYNIGKMKTIGVEGVLTEEFQGQIVGYMYSDSFQHSFCYGRSEFNISLFGNKSLFDTKDTFLSKESFYNGEVAYLLSQSSATWGQNLSSENSLPNPCASEKYKVYKACTGYTNDENELHHSVVNGFCTNDGCDYYEEPHYNEEDEVYEISNAGQLYAYADKAQTVYTKGARLMADIVVNEEPLIQEDGTPVIETANLRKWKGLFRSGGIETFYNQQLIFDGNNHSISGLYANGSGRQGFALYNYGTVKNLQIKNSVFISTGNDGITGNGAAGGIVAGDLRGGNPKIENCSFEGYVEGTERTGGIAGANITTNNCYVDAYVTGSGVINPIVAYGDSRSPITNTAYNTDKYTAECTTSGVKGFTTDQFASGEVAYVLNQGSSDDTTGTWKQNLDGESKDSTPTLNTESSTVYRYNSTNCAGNDKNPIVYVYTNDVNKNNTNVNDSHTYAPDTENLTQHKCSECGDTEDHTFTYKKEDNDNAIIATCSVCGATYTVKLTNPAAASDGKLVYDGTARKAEAAIESGNTGIETIPAITYAAVTDAKTSDYSTTVPKDAGTYKAKLTLGTGDKAVSIETEFTIEKATPMIAWAENQTKQAATYTGEEIAVSKITAPTVTLLNGETFSATDSISYSYRKLTDSTVSGVFISGLPVDIGIYEIKAAIPAEGNYTVAETADTMQLTIAYLVGAPDAVVTDGNNKTYNSDAWCPSDIVLKAPDGYKISSTVNGSYEASFTYTGTTENETITYYLKADNSGEIAEKSVTVKMDRTAPDFSSEQSGINISMNGWNSLLSKITFGLYKGSLDVNIKADDSQSGVAEYYYYIDNSGSTTTLTAEELADKTFTKVAADKNGTTKLTEITSDNNYVIYAYAIDAVGNMSGYICSDGIVLDNTAPKLTNVSTPAKSNGTLSDTSATITFTGSEAGTYYYILKEDGKSAPTVMSDFATKTAGDKVDTWTAEDGVPTGTLTADEGNTIKLTGLKANTSYILYLEATDAAGNASVVETEAADGNSGIVSVSFTTTKTVPYVKTAPVLSGTYGDKFSELSVSIDYVVVASQGSTKQVRGTWSISSEYLDKIPTAGTSEKYTLTFTPTGNDADIYDSVTCEVTPEISKKPIIVEIANKEKSYGDEIPELTWKLVPISLGGKIYNTLVTGDTEKALGISLSTTAKDNSNVGTYAITGLSDSANYEVSFIGSGSDGKSGVLTVKQAANSFTTALSCSGYTYAKDETPKPNATAKFGSVTYKYATVGSDGNAPAADSAYTDVIPVNAGTYAVKAYVAETDNYAGLVSDSVVFTIAKAAKVPNMPEAVITPAHSTAKVGDITLPNGWSWLDVDKDTVLADKTPVTATAIYTGADKGNYETESVIITIIRSICDHTHTEIRNQKEATCTQTGYTGDTYCADCNKLLGTGKELAAQEHDYKAIVTKQPTVTEEGIMTYTCFMCGHSYTQPIAKIKADDSNKNNGNENQNSKSDSTNGTDNGNSIFGQKPETGNGTAKNNIGENNADQNTSANQNIQSDSGTETKPYIKDDSGKEGWDVIKSQLEETKSGDTVTVAMNGTTVVPKNIFDRIKGSDVTLVLDMGNGLSWKINGKDIIAPAGDIDFGVTVGADAGKSIPVDVINSLTGGRSSMNLTLAYDGEFGFNATLTVNMEAKNAGLYANLFYYNEQNGQFEFVSAGQIDVDGNAELAFTHASDYTIVIDTAVMNDENEEIVTSTESTETSGDETIQASKEDDVKADTWNPIIIIIGICIVLAALGAVIFLRKKSHSEEK